MRSFQEDLNKLENDKAYLADEQKKFDEQIQVFEKNREQFEDDKALFEKEKAEIEQERIETQKKASDDASGLQLRIAELQERENILAQREKTLNDQLLDLQYRPYQYMPDGYAQQNATEYGTCQQMPMQNNDGYRGLYERAQAEGIRLNMAGNMKNPVQAQPSHPTPISSKKPNARCYNVGLTLFKSAFIIFCITLFESLLIFFMKDYLGVSVAYPAVCFGIGFAAFILCATLYACGYRANARKKKHPTYMLTSAVIFVIAVIVVSMVAVYFKAQVSIPTQLLSYVIIPVAYLLNILFFSAFYHMFSSKSSYNK